MNQGFDQDNKKSPDLEKNWNDKEYLKYLSDQLENAQKYYGVVGAIQYSHTFGTVEFPTQGKTIDRELDGTSKITIEISLYRPEQLGNITQKMLDKSLEVVTKRERDLLLTGHGCTCAYCDKSVAPVEGSSARFTEEDITKIHYPCKVYFNGEEVSHYVTEVCGGENGWVLFLQDKTRWGRMKIHRCNSCGMNTCMQKRYGKVLVVDSHDPCTDSWIERNGR